MEYLQDFSDERQRSFCAHCGGDKWNRDHIPSLVFLDEPYPENLPVVPSCCSCNENLSLDEEYLACLIDCVCSGRVCEESVAREKVRRILHKKPALKRRLEAARMIDGDRTEFTIEGDRAVKVLLKLARGHAAHELGEPQLYEPTHFNVVPLPLMKERVRFEAPPDLALFPEVGSRAMQRMFQSGALSAPWIVVQPSRYRFLACGGQTVEIRIVISEYLACEVIW